MPASRTSSAATERLRRRWCPSDPRPCRVELRCSTTAHHREDSHVSVSRLDASAYRSTDLPRSFTNASHLGANVEADARQGGRHASRDRESLRCWWCSWQGSASRSARTTPGERNGVAQGIEQVQVAQENGQDVQVVHVVDEGQPRLLPRVLPVPAVLHRAVLPDRRGLPRRRPLGPRRSGGHGPGPWNDEGRQRFEERAREWHTERARRDAAGRRRATGRLSDGTGRRRGRRLPPPRPRERLDPCSGSWSSRTRCRSRERCATTSRSPASR